MLHYSDKHVMLRQVETGILFSSAEDVQPCRYSYEETDEPIPSEELSDTEALKIITGDE